MSHPTFPISHLLFLSFQHAYELEKFLRTAFSHRAVAGVTLSELWDKGASHPGSGLYAANKQPKPAATKVRFLSSIIQTHTNGPLARTSPPLPP